MASGGALFAALLTYMKFQSFSESTNRVIKMASDAISINERLLNIKTTATTALVFGTTGVAIIIGIMVLIGRISGGGQTSHKQSKTPNAAKSPQERKANIKSQRERKTDTTSQGGKTTDTKSDKENKTQPVQDVKQARRIFNSLVCLYTLH